MSVHDILLLSRESEVSSFKPPGRVEELDGVRGLAIILVLIWHYVVGQFQVPPGSIEAYGLRLLAFAWGGVDVFFVLSGYLVGGLFISFRNRNMGAQSVLIRRLFRIVPLYSMSLILFFAFRANIAYGSEGFRWLFNGEIPGWSYAILAQNVTMALVGDIGGNWLGITWSLALEVQFYVFLAVLIAWVPPERLVATLLLLTAFAVILRVVLVTQHPLGGFAGFLLMPSRLDSVCLGVIAACVVKDVKLAERVTSSAKLLIAVILSCLAIVMALCAEGHGIGSFGMSAVGHLLLAVGSALLIVLLVSTPDGRLRRSFRFPPLVAAGTISFGIFLVHQPVAGLLHYSVLGQSPRIASPLDFVVTAAALVTTLVLANLSWRYFEQPLIEVGRRLTSVPAPVT